MHWLPRPATRSRWAEVHTVLGQLPDDQAAGEEHPPGLPAAETPASAATRLAPPACRLAAGQHIHTCARHEMHSDHVQVLKLATDLGRLQRQVAQQEAAQLATQRVSLLSATSILVRARHQPLPCAVSVCSGTGAGSDTQFCLSADSA